MNKTPRAGRTALPTQFCGDSCGLHEPIRDPESMSDAEFPPTSCLPGSAEKMAVMRDRYASGLPAFHPRDARRDDEERFLFRNAAGLSGVGDSGEDQDDP